MINSFKNTLAAIALSAVASVASAAPTLDIGAPLTFSGTRSSTLAATDSFAFIAGTSVTGATGFVAAFELPGFLSLSGLSAAIYGGSTLIGSFSQTGSTPGAVIYSGSAALTPGSTYELRVTAAGNPTGSYVASVAAVPEPHEWAMMLAGLALVGFVARRKRSEAVETTGAMA